MARNIVMVGTAASRASAPCDNPDVEVWGVSSRGGLSRADRWFEIHRIDGTFDADGEADLWRATLSKFTADIPELWMIYPEPDLHPKVVGGWHQKIVDRFDNGLLTSTFAWMMGQAIVEMAPVDADGTRHFAEPGSTISIYGVDMEYGTEYSQQRAGFRALIEIAEQLGIKVNRVRDGGLIYEPVPYPMWQDDPLLCKLELRNRDAKRNLASFNESIGITREMIASTNGALAELDMLQAPVPVLVGEDVQPKPYDPAERRVFLDKQLSDLMGTSASISRDLVGWEAIDQEQNWLRNFLQP